MTPSACARRYPPATFVPRVADSTELVRGDVFNPASLTVALAGVDTAYYLVHSLGTASGDFYEQELRSARNFAEAARDASVRRVIYLGGLGRGGDELSPHLASRQDVGRPMIKLPWLTPRLSSGWLALVTPLYFRVGRHLLEGVRNETVVTSDASTRDFPRIRPMGIEAAIARAITNEDRTYAETRWSDARSATPPPKHWPAARFGRRYVDQRTVDVPCPPSQAFGAVLCIGGSKGWYAWTWLWSLRGLLDQIGGGVGSRRGRRDPTCVIPGDTVDFWRVETLEPDRLLRLTAEMRMPGRGWLQFELTPLPDGQTRIVQTAMWDPVGLFGQLYWFSLWPLHEIIFRSMIHGIAVESGCLPPRVKRRRFRAGGAKR